MRIDKSKRTVSYLKKDKKLEDAQAGLRPLRSEFMFQITILNNKQARLIDAPNELQAILKRIGVEGIFINPDLIQDIQNYYPGVTIKKLSTKPEINRYELPEKLQILFDKAKGRKLSKLDSKALIELERLARKTGGLGKMGFCRLCRLAGDL